VGADQQWNEMKERQRTRQMGDRSKIDEEEIVMQINK
jgi:hypothetical protein